MEAVVRRVLAAVESSRALSSSSNTPLEEVDRILLSLSCSSAALGELLNSIIIRQEINAQPEVVAQLQELHWCIDNVLLEWERRLQGSLTVSMQSSPGRRKKPVNIPMVSK